MKDAIQKGNTITIEIETNNVDSILYFLTNSQGEKIVSNKLDVKDNNNTINIDSKHTENLETGANSIKIFATSNSVLKPDFYESSFIVTENQLELPTNTHENINVSEDNQGYELIIISLAIIIIAIIIYLKKRNQASP